MNSSLVNEAMNTSVRRQSQPGLDVSVSNHSCCDTLLQERDAALQRLMMIQGQLDNMDISTDTASVSCEGHITEHQGVGMREGTESNPLDLCRQNTAVARNQEISYQGRNQCADERAALDRAKCRPPEEVQHHCCGKNHSSEFLQTQDYGDTNATDKSRNPNIENFTPRSCHAKQNMNPCTCHDLHSNRNHGSTTADCHLDYQSVIPSCHGGHGDSACVRNRSATPCGTLSGYHGDGGHCVTPVGEYNDKLRARTHDDYGKMGTAKPEQVVTKNCNSTRSALGDYVPPDGVTMETNSRQTPRGQGRNKRKPHTPLSVNRRSSAPIPGSGRSKRPNDDKFLRPMTPAKRRVSAPAPRSRHGKLRRSLSRECLVTQGVRGQARSQGPCPAPPPSPSPSPRSVFDTELLTLALNATVVPLLQSTPVKPTSKTDRESRSPGQPLASRLSPWKPDSEDMDDVQQMETDCGVT